MPATKRDFGRLLSNWKCAERLDAQEYQSASQRADFRAGYSDGFHNARVGSGIDKRNAPYDAGFAAGVTDRPASIGPRAEISRGQALAGK